MRLAGSHIAIHVVRQRQVREVPVVLDAKLVYRRQDSIGLHVDVGPHCVIVEHEESVGVHLSRGGCDIAFDALVSVLGVNVDPIEISVWKGLQGLR
jgi:hypothetical protein